MAAVPITYHAFVYPKNKTVAPFPATIVGFAEITGLEVGGGPIIPPDDLPPKPPGDWEIWPNPPEGVAPHPEHPIVLPDPIVPPDQPPSPIPPPHEGWNWSAVKNGWYYLYVPGAGEAEPKGRR